MPWSDFGLGLDDDARKNAMRQALVDAGIAIMAGAPTQGFGAFSALGPALADSYRKNVYGAHDLQRQQDLDEQNEAYRQERLESLRQVQEDRIERRGDRDSARDAHAAEMETRRRAIAEVQDPKVRGELQLRVGQSNFWEVYDRKTKPPEAPKEPQTERFPDGSLRRWVPEKNDWELIQAKPADEDGETGLLDESTRRRLKGELSSMKDAKTAALRRADAEIARLRTENAKGTAPPVPIPDRLELARKYESEELGAARYRHGVSAPAASPAAAPARPGPSVRPAAPPPAREAPTPAAAPPSSPAPAVAPAQPAPQATPEQSIELRALIEQRVAGLGLPPEVAEERKAQILERARQALEQGIPPEQILQELR